MLKKFLLFSIILLTNIFLPSIVTAENPLLNNGKAVLENFVTYGKDQGSAEIRKGSRYTGESTWEIRGRQARLRESQTELQQFEIFLYEKNGRKTTISSPRCEYNQLTEEIKSDSTIRVTSPGLRITGIGYDLYLQKDTRILVIRSTVHIVLHKNKINQHLKKQPTHP